MLLKVRKINNSLFQEINKISQISIPLSVTKIEENASNGFKSLTQTVIPFSVT